MTGALACLAKVTLGILNTLFLLVGLALIAVGAIVKHGADFIGDVMNKLKDVPEVSKYLDTAAWILIGLGVFFTIIGVLGGCGACCSIKVFLILYSIIIIILILAQIVFIALLFSDKLKELLGSALKDTLKKYKPLNAPNGGTLNIDTSDALSRGLDAMFIGLKCCGLDNYKDVSSGSTPITCCNAFTTDLLDMSSVSQSNVITELDHCSASGTNSYRDKGCYSALIDQIENNKAMVIGVTVAILLFQVICVVFAILIIKDKNKNAVSPVS